MRGPMILHVRGLWFLTKYLIVPSPSFVPKSLLSCGHCILASFMVNGSQLISLVETSETGFSNSFSNFFSGDWSSEVCMYCLFISLDDSELVVVAGRTFFGVFCDRTTVSFCFSFGFPSQQLAPPPKATFFPRLK